MSLAAGVVFKTSEDVDFVSELAGWISPPQAQQSEGAEGAEAAAEGEGQEAAPVLQPSAFQEECNTLKTQKDFEALSTKLGDALKERVRGEHSRDSEG